jgi:pimeloyl-ACP methyl ester carboxylesterase
MMPLDLQPVRFINGMAGVLAGREGRPALLLHPIGFAACTWRHVQPAVASVRRTLALDLLGFGQSEKPAGADYSVRSQAERVLAVLDELGWDRVDLIGNSLGGAVSLATALVAPERVASLTLIGTVAYPGGMPPFGLLARVPFAEHTARVTSGLAAQWIIAFCYADRRRLERDAIRDYVRVLGTREGCRAFRLTGEALYGPALQVQAGRYGEIRCPALVLHGDRDPIIPRWVAVRLARELPVARLRWLRQVGHFPQEEDPAQVLSRLMPFLGSDGRAAA